MNNQKLKNIEKELYKVIIAVYNCKTIKEQVGNLDDDTKIIENLIDLSMILSTYLKQEHDKVSRLKVENDKLLEKVDNAREALE